MMTEWYPAHIKPVRVGMYEVKQKGIVALVPTYAYWNGGHWGFYRSDFRFAGLYSADKSEANQEKEWRGFTTPQE